MIATGLTLPAEEIARINAYFAPPALEPKKASSERVERRRAKDAKFSNFFAVQRRRRTHARLCDRHRSR